MGNAMLVGLDRLQLLDLKKINYSDWKKIATRSGKE